MPKNALDTAWLVTRIGDEFGLTQDDLARLYGVDVTELDRYLASLGTDQQAVFERILSDVDTVRVGYRHIQLSDDQIVLVRDLIAIHPFHPLVSQTMADQRIGWRLSKDDAQFVAFRAADVVGMEFDWGEALRLRLNRAIIWPDPAMPNTDQAFRDRLADVTFYLMELGGVL